MPTETYPEHLEEAVCDSIRRHVEATFGFILRDEDFVSLFSREVTQAASRGQ